MQWNRRDWLTHTTGQAAALLTVVPRNLCLPRLIGGWGVPPSARPIDPTDTAALAAQATHLDPTPWQALALRAVDAAQAAGAKYADARLTRTVGHQYIQIDHQWIFFAAWEMIGVGVRALVNGYWGFAAAPYLEQDEIIGLARAAVAQATTNAKGPPREVDLGQYPRATGTWRTPVLIDPFDVSIEEKRDFLTSWDQGALRYDIDFKTEGQCLASFCRQERVVATSEGSLFTQTCLESGGRVVVGGTTADGQKYPYFPSFQIRGLQMAGRGWEVFLDAMKTVQFPVVRESLVQRALIGSKISHVGRYTIVCDGLTMASLLEKTLGTATQLDRSLGYEANAEGTSFIEDPLAMVGNATIAAPAVTVTANRSDPGGLATAHWDEEGVVPVDTTLIKNGVLTDFQTTREQAAWLAPYYQKVGRLVRSNGCAAAQDALVIPMQHMPNLSLAPNPTAVSLENLVSDVKDGILIENGTVQSVDFQERNGLLTVVPDLGGSMREIKNGRIGKALKTGAIWFDSQDLWKHLKAVGGTDTQDEVGASPMMPGTAYWKEVNMKGQPPQGASYTVKAVAATIPNQPLIDPSRKA